MSDKELLEAISDKDKNAFNAFYNKYSRLLYRLAVNRTGNSIFAQEITQDFWMKIWLEPAKVLTDEEDSAIKYLQHLFNYHLLDYLKKVYEKAHREDSIADMYQFEEELSYSHIFEDYDIKELEEVINRILENLPKSTCHVFNLIYEKEYSIKEVAKKLNMNERTVNYKAKEGLSVVKSSLKEWYSFSNKPKKRMI